MINLDDDNILLDILYAPIHLTRNTLDTIKNEKNAKTIYRYVILGNIITIIYGFIIKDFTKTLYCHIGSVLFVLYTIYITQSQAHKEPYKKLYKNIKDRMEKKKYDDEIDEREHN